VIGMSFQVLEDVRQHENFRERGFAKLLKAALKDNVYHWHRSFAAFHFTRQAYSRYRYLGVYRHQKKGGEPLVETGTLRRRMLRPRNETEMTGTSRRVTLKMPMGRPPEQTDALLRKRTIRVMREKGMSYRQALNYVMRRTGYSKKGREMIQSHIPVVAGGEARHLRGKLTVHIVAGLNRKGAKRRRTIRG